MLTTRLNTIYLTVAFSQDGHSQLRTMADGWKHDVNGWRLVTFFSRKAAETRKEGFDNSLLLISIITQTSLVIFIYQ